MIVLLAWFLIAHTEDVVYQAACTVSLTTRSCLCVNSISGDGASCIHSPRPDLLFSGNCGVEAGNLREECGIDRDGHAGLCVPFDPN